MGDWLKNYGISEIKNKNSETLGKKRHPLSGNVQKPTKKKSTTSKRYAISGGKALVVHEDKKGPYVKRKVSGKLKPIRVKNTYNTKEEAQGKLKKSKSRQQKSLTKQRKRRSASKKLGPKRK